MWCETQATSRSPDAIRALSLCYAASLLVLSACGVGPSESASLSPDPEPGQARQALCGDFVCDGDETIESCPEDCGFGCIPVVDCTDRCGTVSDGCGGTADCGGCANGLECGGGGFPNTCPACTPVTCAQVNATYECGFVPDGCGNVVACGSQIGGCPNNGACTNHVCGACVPTSCAALGKSCGTAADGCGGTLNCGAPCPTESEPNDTPSSSDLIGTLSDQFGRISAASDVDYFKMTMSGGRTFTLKLTVPAGKNYDLQLYRGSTLVATSSQGTGLPENITHTNSAFPATFYFRVYSADGSFSASDNYALDLNW